MSAEGPAFRSISVSPVSRQRRNGSPASAPGGSGSSRNRANTGSPCSIPKATSSTSSKLRDRLGSLLFEVMPYVGGAVDAEDDEVTGTAALERGAHRRHLVDDDLSRPRAGAVTHRLLHSLQDALRNGALDLSPRIFVLAHDDLVEVAGRDPADLPHVFVPAIARRGDHRNPAARAALPIWLGQAFYEVAHHGQAMRIMGVIDNHADAMELEHIEPAGRFVEGSVEGAQALADVVEIGSRGVGGGRRRQRILHVHARLAFKSGGEHAGVADGGCPSTFPDDDHFAVRPRMQREGFA